MADDTKFAIGLSLFCVLIVVVIIGASMMLEYATCHAQTESIGFPSQWSPFGGCRIEVKQGKWIPLSSYYFMQE